MNNNALCPVCGHECARIEVTHAASGKQPDDKILVGCSTPACECRFWIKREMLDQLDRSVTPVWSAAVLEIYRRGKAAIVDDNGVREVPDF